MFSLWCSSWRLLGSPGIFILKNPRSSFKSSCNTPYVIMQSPTTGISFQHLELLLFPPLLVRILEETLNSSDLADEDKSGCQAWNFYEEKKNNNTTSIFDPTFLEKAPESQRWSRICQRSLWMWTMARRVSGRRRRERWWWKRPVSLLLIHVTVRFMLLTTKCENRTRNRRLEFQSGNDNKSILEWVFKTSCRGSRLWVLRSITAGRNLEKPWNIITEETYWSLIGAATLS